jgi:hypothetical protein
MLSSVRIRNLKFKATPFSSTILHFAIPKIKKGFTMALYLRDQHIQNVSTDTEALTQISNVFAERFSQLDAELKEKIPQGKTPLYTYIIRFDNKGYRVFSLDELLRYFNQAGKVERIIFTLESEDAISSNRSNGAYLELCLDTKEPSRSILIASSDNKDWADASFAAVHQLLTKYRTKNGLARSLWTSLFVQIIGVVVGFIASLWVSFKIAPNLNIENSFVITFLFSLLVFSNIWGYLNQSLFGFMANIFPNIEFIRPAKARLHWLLQTIVGSAVFALVVYFLGASLSFLTTFLSGLFNAGA